MKASILTGEGKLACPHCGTEYGDAIGDQQVAVGQISFVGDRSHKVVCNGCRNSFMARPPRESKPEQAEAMPARGMSDPL